MKTFNVCIGVYVRTYAKFDIEAESAEQAKHVAIAEFENDNGRAMWEDTDYTNMALPSICSISDDDTGEDVLEGFDFASESRDCQDLASAEMLKALKLAEAWVNDEAERRGDEDAEYAEPASSLVELLRTAVARAEGRLPIING